MKHVGDFHEYITTYVDDLAICSKNPQAIADQLMNDYKYKLHYPTTLVVTILEMMMVYSVQLLRSILTR